MSKRTHTSPYAVEYLCEDGTWFIYSYENSERLAKKAARNFLKLYGINSPTHRLGARVLGNPNNEHRDLGVIYTLLET